MPYRRLPTTDAARLRALDAAIEKAEQLELGKLAFSTRYLHPLRNYQQQLQTIKFQQDQSWKQVVRQSKEHQKKTAKARLFMSHFIQVLNMGIIREEIPPTVRKLFGLDQLESKLPNLQSDDQLLQWGQMIIDGEGKRVRTGGVPIMNPNIGNVRVWYERYKESHHSQQTALKSYQRSSAQLVDLRRKTDLLLQAVWNEVEEFFQDHSPDERRAQGQEYGIVYIYRKSEKKTT